MQNVFLAVLDMSIIASIVITVVLLARLLLKKAPKRFSYVLWVVVLFRLVCPISFESPFSLIPEQVQSIPQRTALDETVSPKSAASAAYRAIGDAVNGGLGTVTIYLEDTIDDGNIETTEAFHSQVWLLFFAYLWPVGIAGMLIYSTVSLILLRRKLIGAVRLRDNIYMADHIVTPFVIGLFHPKIYLPSIISAEEQDYIILHEQTHIERFDHVVKMIAFLALAVHWFNPLVWVAFVSAVKDMEMSCDERVLKQMGGEIKTAYSTSLLSLAIGHRLINSSPLAFGEGNIKSRIKNVMNFKKPAAWAIIAATVAVIITAACLLTNPAKSSSDVSTPNAAQNLSDRRSMIMADGQLYLDTGKEITMQLKSITVMGEISSSVDASEVPIQDGQSNFGSIGAPYMYWNDGLAIKLNDEWYYFEKEPPSLIPTSPKLSLDQIVGIEMPELDYADDNVVIFHGYFGMFVYDLKSHSIIRSLDLEPIGCHQTQGSNACEVVVSKDGGKVFMHTMETNKLYVWDLTAEPGISLYEASYDSDWPEPDERFRTVAIEELIDNSDASYSYRAVVGNGEYSYLHTTDWTLGTLTYVRSSDYDMEDKLFKSNATDAAISQIPKGDYVSRYDKVEIAILLKEREHPIYRFESVDYQTVAYIDTKIRQSSPYDKSPPQDSQTKLYNIKLSNEISSYACGLYYDTLNNEAYIVRDGGPSVTDVEFAQYIVSLFESSSKE